MLETKVDEKTVERAVQDGGYIKQHEGTFTLYEPNGDRIGTVPERTLNTLEDREVLVWQRSRKRWEKGRA